MVPHVCAWLDCCAARLHAQQMSPVAAVGRARVVSSTVVIRLDVISLRGDSARVHGCRACRRSDLRDQSSGRSAGTPVARRVARKHRSSAESQLKHCSQGSQPVKVSEKKTGVIRGVLYGVDGRDLTGRQKCSVSVTE